MQSIHMSGLIYCLFFNSCMWANLVTVCVSFQNSVTVYLLLWVTVQYLGLSWGGKALSIR